MRLSLQSYFDVGASYGLGDDIFRGPGAAALVPDIAQIGIRNPLGMGIVCPVDERILAAWRTAAEQKVDVPEMELGYPDAKDNADEQFIEFKQQLKQLIRAIPIARAELTVYAIGTVFVRLDFGAGLPLEFLKGFGRCFEYAAYLDRISHALHRAARETINEATGGQSTSIKKLSRRPGPKIEEDERGNRESKLFSGFTHVIMCIDEDDDVEAVKQTMNPPPLGAHETSYLPLRFEYHGTLFFDWASCVLEPRSFDDPDESPEVQIQRMLQCIQIAHTFYGTCEAFQNLFLHETLRQTEGYVKGQPLGRDPKELNRLRTLALAVVSLTSYTSVAIAEEDQKYFAAWERLAKIEDQHRLIQERCEILHNVQVAETQSDEARRQNLLNRVVLFLTGFTFLSVFGDSYAFLEREDKWLPLLIHRTVVLGSLVVLIVLVISAFVRWSSWKRS